MKLISYKVWGNKSSTWLDKLISIVSFGNYSHTEIAFENGECFSISPRENEGRIKKINYTEARWDIQEIDVSIEQENIIYEHCVRLSSQGLKYDYIGALTSPLRLCIQSEAKIFCSEICINTLNKFGVIGFDKGCKYTPSRANKEIQKIDVFQAGRR